MAVGPVPIGSPNPEDGKRIQVNEFVQADLKGILVFNKVTQKYERMGQPLTNDDLLQLFPEAINLLYELLMEVQRMRTGVEFLTDESLEPDPTSIEA